MGDKPREPKALYHYTSTNAFKAIVENGVMRASRYDQMNDHGEFQFGVDKFLESLAVRDVPQQDMAYFNFLKEGVEAFRKTIHDVYLVSFSAAADSLEQWRAYCPKGGVAIGFKTKAAKTGFLRDISGRFPDKLIENPLRADQRIRLKKCHYSNKNGHFTQIEDLSDAAFAVQSFPDMFRQLQHQPEMGAFFSPLLSASLFSTIPFIKHGAYRAEKEWRFVNSHSDERDYPVRLSDTNRFYIELKFLPQKCISEVWISPHGDTRGAENAAEYIRRKFNLKYEIKRSTIPFRIG